MKPIVQRKHAGADDTAALNAALGMSRRCGSTVDEAQEIVEQCKTQSRIGV
jgi:bacterioferritin-associated ferredoxin